MSASGAVSRHVLHAIMAVNAAKLLKELDRLCLGPCDIRRQERPRQTCNTDSLGSERSCRERSFTKGPYYILIGGGSGGGNNFIGGPAPPPMALVYFYVILLLIIPRSVFVFI